MILLVSPAASAADSIELTMKLQPGESQTLVLDIDQTIDQRVQGNSMKMDQLIGMTMTYTATDRPSDNGGVWIDMTYDRVRFKMSGIMAIDFDSDAPGDVNNPLAKAFGAMVGQKLSMEFLPDGDVPNIEGIAELQENMLNSMGLPEGQQKSMMGEMLKMQYNEDTIKQMVGSMGGMYPGKAVSLGDKW
ncbi:MAG: DUF6263 family protein, partial [Planctomycetota bacterium]